MADRLTSRVALARFLAHLILIGAAAAVVELAAPLLVRPGGVWPGSLPAVQVAVLGFVPVCAGLFVSLAAPLQQRLERRLTGTGATTLERLERRLAEQKLLVTLNETLRQVHDATAGLEAAVRIVRDRLPATGCLFVSRDGEDGWRSVRAGRVSLSDPASKIRKALSTVPEGVVPEGVEGERNRYRILDTQEVVRIRGPHDGAAAQQCWVLFSCGGRAQGMLVIEGAAALEERPGLLRAVGAVFSQALGAHWTIRELTELKLHNQRIMDSMQGCLVVLDTNLVVTTMNRAGARFVGLPVSSVLGRRLEDVPALLPLREVARDSLESNRTVRSAEVNAGGRPERPTVLGVSTSIVTDAEGASRAVVLSFVDLSDVKQMQRQLTRSEKLASIGQLAAGISHELRNPLGSIVGYAELIRERISSDDEVVQRGLATILSESERSKRIIESLLDYSRVKKPEFREVNLNALVMDTLPLVRHELARTEIVLQTDLQPDLAPVRADAEQMREVLINLLLNAREAMREGGRMIRITTGSNSRNVFISIRDEGKGITEEDMDRLFAPFFTTKQTGTGLGLPIVHRIVEAHRGLIHVETNPGGGSTFTVTLPPAHPSTVSGDDQVM